MLNALKSICLLTAIFRLISSGAFAIPMSLDWRCRFLLQLNSPVCHAPPLRTKARPQSYGFPRFSRNLYAADGLTVIK